MATHFDANRRTEALSVQNHVDIIYNSQFVLFLTTWTTTSVRRESHIPLIKDPITNLLREHQMPIAQPKQTASLTVTLTESNEKSIFL